LHLITITHARARAHTHARQDSSLRTDLYQSQKNTTHVGPWERRDSNPLSQQASTSGPRIRARGHRDRRIQNI